MDFLSLRDQIYDWTLDSDDKLFNEINKLSQHIFQTEKAINQSVVITKSTLNQSSTILNNNFNHFLRLSENKFTQNKIAQTKRPVQSTAQTQEKVLQVKTKMEIFKEALSISLKTLEIKQQEKQTDNVSVSELSLSQAIFKNARLPPYFGSKQFRAQKFLNLFFDQDLHQSVISKKQIDSLSNQPLSTPSQDISSNNGFYNNTTLAPPPSFDALNLGNNGNFNIPSGNILPPPPPLGLNLPPPPPLNTILPLVPQSNSSTLPGVPNILPSAPKILIDQRDENKALLQSILNSTRNAGNTGYQARNSFIQQPTQQNVQQQQYQEEEPARPVQKKPLSFQQELALKLKYGKDYKPPVNQTVINKQPVSQKNDFRQINQPRQIEAPMQRTNSFRQSTKIQEIIGSVNPIKSNQKQSNKEMFNDQDQEEENALFGSNKRKNTPNSQLSTQNSKFGTKNQAEQIMSRSTFNQDMLFKKKPVFSKQTVIPAKTQQKQQKKPNRASVLFNQESDQEEADFTFKKKTNKAKPQQKKPQEKKQPQQVIKKPIEQKKSNPLGLPAKPQIVQKSNEQPKKKTVNKLFGGDSDEEDTSFGSKKPIQKKESSVSQKNTQSPSKPIQKVQQKPVIVKPVIVIQQKIEQPKKKTVNKLFGGDSDQEDDIFAKKKPLIKKASQNTSQSSQSPSKIQKIQQKHVVKNTQKPVQQIKKSPLNPLSKATGKKSSLFGDQDQQEDFSFKPKSKVVKKQSKKQQQQTVVIRQKIELPKKQILVPKKEQSKAKNPLFGTIDEQQNEQSSIIIAPKKIQLVKEQIKQQIKPKQQKSQSIQNAQQQSQEVKRMKRIAKMGGQPMMGMAQLIPKGMVITKPSETRQQQKIARQNKQHEQKIQENIKPQQKIQKKVYEQMISQNKRPLDPLQRLIGEIIKPNSVQNQQTQPVKENKLDPLERLIKKQIIDKREEQPLQIKKNTSKVIQENNVENSSIVQKNQQSENTGLNLRRKKNKPKRATEYVFDQQVQDKAIKTVIVNDVQQAKKSNPIQNNFDDPKQKIQQPKVIKINPLIQPISKPSSQKQSHIQKMSRMGMAGMGMPGMMPGLGPLFPKGAMITKPSQAKKLEQQALQKIKKQEQQQKINEQNQNQLKLKEEEEKIQQQSKRKANEKEVEQRNIQIQNQNRRKRKIQEEKEHQQEAQRQQTRNDKIRQDQIRQQQIRQQIIRKQQQIRQQQDRQQLIRQEQARQKQTNLLKIQQENERKRIAEQQRQKQLQDLRRQKQYQRKIAEQQARKYYQQQRLEAQRLENQRAQEQKLQAQRIQLQKKKKANLPSLPVFDAGIKKQATNPLLGKSKASNPLNIPTMPPKVNPLGGTQKISLGGPLSGPLNGPGATTIKSTSLSSNTGLNLPQMPSISKETPKNTGKKSLFDDQDEIVVKKPQKIVSMKTPTVGQKKKGSLFDDDDNDSGFGSKVKPKKKTNAKKGGLFDEDDDDQGFGFGKKAKKAQVKQLSQPFIETKAVVQPKNIPQKKKLLKDASDEEDGPLFGKKKQPIKEIISQPVKTLKVEEQIKIKSPSPQTKIAQKSKAKKGLFGDSDSQQDSGFQKKKPLSKPAVEVNKSATNNFEQKEKKITQQSKGKKGLFGGSDDEEDDPFKKRPVKKQQAPKPISNPVMNNEPMIPTKNTLSQNQLGGTNNSNPLLGASQPKSQPLIQSTPSTAKSNPLGQQKKRNIFEQSQQESQSSPIIASKSKPQVQQQAVQKKGLISQDSEQQKPTRRQEKVINVKPVQQQESQPVSQNNNNRKLFDDSDDSDDQAMNKKRRTATNKIKKLF